MLNFLRGVLLIGCLTGTLFGFDFASAKWRTFLSTKYNYVLRYPPSWYLFTTQLNPTLYALDILNFPASHRVEGVVLRDGGAEITAAAAPPKTQTIEQWVSDDTKFETHIRQRRIESFAKNPSGCARIVEVISLSEAGPGRNFSHTTYYCSTKHGLYA